MATVPAVSPAQPAPLLPPPSSTTNTAAGGGSGGMMMLPTQLVPAHTAIVTPPINYSMLCPGVHRSGYPAKRNFSFLATLRLKSIMFLCPEAYAEANQRFCQEQGIQLLLAPMEGNKEPFQDIPPAAMHRAVSFLCDTRNHPILVHCNKGKHRTGTVCGCLRQLQGWSLTSTFDEYIRFAGDKARFVDQQYLELYAARVLHLGPRDGSCLPRWLVRRECVHFIAPESPEAAIVALQPPGGGGDGGADGEKKDKKDKKDKKEKAAAAEGAAADADGAVDAAVKDKKDKSDKKEKKDKKDKDDD